MGFLKFLKKKGEAKFPEDDLDIPPAPPSIEHEDLGLESLGKDMPTPPELPELPEIEEEPIEEEKPKIPSFRPERFIPLEKIEKGPVREEKKHLEEIHAHKGITKPIFIQLKDYKEVLDEIEMIKGHLDNFEKVSVRLNELKEDKDKKFVRWNDEFKDLQKKLIFVDKALFAK